MSLSQSYWCGILFGLLLVIMVFMLVELVRSALSWYRCRRRP